MKLLFFAPYSAIWQHAFPEALVARSFHQMGNEVSYVTCGGLFNKMCVSMDSHLININANPIEKKKICDICSARKKILSTFIGVPFLDLKNYISAEDYSAIEALLKRGSSKKDLLDLVVKDLPVGKYALYNANLKYKKSFEDFSENEWEEYTIDLRHVLLTLFGIEKIIKLKKPDAIVIYNSFYPTNRIAAEISEKLGLKVYWLHAGGNLSNRLQRINFGKGHHYDILNRNLTHWENSYKNVPALTHEILQVRDHFLELIKGINIFVYSTVGKAKLDVAQHFSIAPNQKIVIAVLSSLDERMAVENINVLPKQKKIVFADQLVWLSKLIEYFSEQTDRVLIIRVHPREFPNRRDTQVSAQAKKLQALLANLPPNIKVNWPTDNISMYQLCKFMDVCLHAGSSVGKEVALLGIPVVNYMGDGLSYPVDLGYYADNLENYFNCIEEALSEGHSLELARKAFRWSSFDFVSTVLDISDSCKLVENGPKLNLWQRLIRKITIAIDPYYYDKKSCKNVKSLLKESHYLSEMLKTDAVCKMDVLVDNNKESFMLETKTLKTVLAEIISALYKKDESYNSRLTYREKMQHLIEEK